MSLDRPYHPDVGGLRPHAMERSLEVLDEARNALGIDEAPPCDERGLAT
jgi:hypothetical protein